MVMADSSLQDAELKSQSVGVGSLTDAPATTINNNNTVINGEAAEEINNGENGIVSAKAVAKSEEQLFEEGSFRSDTDTSRPGSVAEESKPTDLKPVKKFAVSKPVSFAKYSVPKTVAASSPIRTNIERAPSSTPTPTSATSLGRPRLVAKSANSLHPKLSSFNPAAPDPMQVWNKNRGRPQLMRWRNTKLTLAPVTPQPSTKHLTDEELKQQYGIHLTSRLQSDGDGKEAKWADIDDDEDDWAPETIEWNDGTKTTVNPADAPTSKQPTISKLSTGDAIKPGNSTPKILSPNYSSSIGPNATVLRVGANAERQQLQRAASQQAKGSVDKSSLANGQAMPAPTPAKSPWAKLPAIDKVSPIEISPNPLTSQSATRYPVQPAGFPGAVQAAQVSSPAKEISADDFSRSWRDSSVHQNRELFMPSSGRYEAVPENRRRLSRNEQSFRAPAVLLRPGQVDSRAPAEPSAAFQTHRTSIDQGRRRASSSISGGSGQIARRMSLKSAEIPDINDIRPEVQADLPNTQQTPLDHEPASLVLPTYQARGDNVPGPSGIPLDSDIEAQRAAQRAAMKENIERARKRKLEEEAREEAAKQERIRAKLAALGPPPTKPVDGNKEGVAEQNKTQTTTSATTQSPPKPPQPLASDGPQQYGMMKVHPLDPSKKTSPSDGLQSETLKSAPEAASTSSVPQQHAGEVSPPDANGSGPLQEPSIVFDEEEANPEPSPKFSKVSVPTIPDARAGWNKVRNEHRQQPTNSLWGLPSNKALGNGTFDQSLAGYAPQDLSRTSSAGQPWINGRTPTVGQSPQLHHANSHVPETRSQLLQSMTSPSQQPLSLNSEADSVLPANRPAPIGPPPHAHGQQHAGLPNTNAPTNGLAAWNNFHNVARVTDKADAERFQREYNERREDERRGGSRQQAPYNFNETFKQVQLGDQAGQRHVANVAHSAHAPNGIFGAIGSMASNESARSVNGQSGRGSRFFPVTNHAIPQERRAATYSHSEINRTPSPPPAEEFASLHPAFDGNVYRPIVHFPREKAVVRLPPSLPLPAPIVQAPEPAQEVSIPQPKVPMTWAARVSMPAPALPVRVVSAPITQNSSWQERFNGLLGRKEAGLQQMAQVVQPAPALAITKEPFDVVSAIGLSVSLPVSWTSSAKPDTTSSKNVEDEEDLFEDREAGSLPIIHLPRDVSDVPLPRSSIPRSVHLAIDPTSAHMFMVSNWSERHAQQKPQYAIIRAPGAIGKGIRKDLPVKGPDTTATSPKPRNVSGHFSHKYPRGRSGFKPRGTAKAH